jgi:AhpC/TSA antioxidant enzyme
VIKRQEEIKGLGAEVLVVAYDEPTLLSAKMLHDVALPFPLLLDRTREAYARWGMGRAGLTGAMLSPSLNWRYLKLMAKGERFLGFAPDTFQLGGDFLVDKQGTLVFVYRMRNNGDRVDTGTLLDGLAHLAGCE